MKKVNNAGESPAAATPSKFKARVVYGFLEQLQVVLLGNPIEGEILKGMSAHVQIGSASRVGNWKIVEIQRMDFINDADNHNFMGLVLKCKDVEEFNLLKSLRVYDEILIVE